MRRRSNQRITKIKKDFILELLKKAEGIDVKDGTSIQPPGSDLIPYPDMNNLRLWTRDYLLKGLTKIYPVKHDENGQTYLTTIIDGLPLHTKLTKTIGTEQQTYVPDSLNLFVQRVGSPKVSSDWIYTGDTTSSNYLRVSNTYGYKDYNSVHLEIDNVPYNGSTIYSVSKNGYTVFTIYIRSGVLKCSTTSSSSADLVNDVRNKKIIIDIQYNYENISVQATADGVTTSATLSYYNPGGTATNDGTNILSTTACNLNLKDSYFIVNGEKISFLHYQTVITEVPVETSKPGLWLSNLSAPYQVSGAGAWLRSNLVHSNEDVFENINSDTIGNYAYSYLQRGIIFEGTLPEDQEFPTSGYIAPWMTGPNIGFMPVAENSNSFCLHWAPSALSCLAIPSIEIQDDSWDTPSYRFGNTYTSYQSLVVPTNPNMQEYEQDLSKYVEFRSAKNNNDNPTSETWYSMRAVGTDWAYELRFVPNGNGSGSDYGVNKNPTGPNGSNGGCVIGTIVYQDSNQGTYCTQEVNSCFQTDQSYFNPQVPDVPSNQPLNNDKDVLIIDTHSGTCCGEMWFNYGDVVQGTMRGISNASVKAFPKCQSAYGNLEMLQPDGTFKVGTSTSGVNFTYNYTNCSQWFTGYRSVIARYTETSGWCSFPGVCTRLYISPEPEEQEGISLYLNIIDLKCQYEKQGIPWTGGCGSNRFSINISTEKCEDSCCTSHLIANNVDINALGDISLLEEKVWNKATIN